MEFTSHSLTDTAHFAETFLKKLVPTQGGATVIGLRGDLGSGKTTLVQAIARILDVDEGVTSPTFVIEKIYEINHPQFDNLVHIDAYRIEDAHELVLLGWDTLLKDSRGLVLVEWPERIQSIMPPRTGYIDCTFVDETTRTFSYAESN